MRQFSDPFFYHSLIEAQKFAYAQRTRLGDVDFVPEAYELAKNMTSAEYTAAILERMTCQAQPTAYYGNNVSAQVFASGIMDQTAHIIGRRPRYVACIGHRLRGQRRVRYQHSKSMVMPSTLACIIWSFQVRCSCAISEFGDRVERRDGRLLHARHGQRLRLRAIAVELHRAGEAADEQHEPNDHL